MSPTPASALLFVRGAVYCAFLPLVAVLLLAPDEPTPVFLAATILLGVGWAGIYVRRPLREGVLARFTASPALRAAEFGLWSVVLTVLLAEAALVLLGTWSTHPLFLAPNAKSERRIENRRFAPHVEVNGSLTNASGYDDTDWSVEKPPGTLRLLALGDSFGFGIVGYEANYLTLLERRLDARLDPPVEILNMGIIAIAPEDYLYLMNNEGLRHAPDAVFVGFYAGNDFQPRRRSSHLHLGSWQLYAFAHRVWWLGGRVPLRSRFDTNPVEAGTSVLDDRATFEEDEFMEINSDYLPWLRVERTRREERALGDTAQVLRTLVERAAPRPVLVAVIPSELQVNAALRAGVLAAHDLDEADLDLDAPVRFLAETLRGTGATVVDLRPAITRADAEESAYHLRDTHWNVHGNRAAADALVEPLAELLERAR